MVRFCASSYLLVVVPEVFCRYRSLLRPLHRRKEDLTRTLYLLPWTQIGAVRTAARDGTCTETTLQYPLVQAKRCVVLTS